jgi:hypothetical protein
MVKSKVFVSKYAFLFHLGHSASDKVQLKVSNSLKTSKNLSVTKT